MPSKVKILLAGAVTALICVGTASALPPGATVYPWVQAPAWVGTGVTGAFVAQAAAPDVQPPAWIPIAQVVQRPAIAGSDYPWVQLPAWVGTAGPHTSPPTASYPWVQPPAWIPIA